MDAIDLKLSQYRASLLERAAASDNPELSRLALDILAMERTKELVPDLIGSVPLVTPSSVPLITASNDVAPEGPLTRGDACVIVLKETGKAMHVKSLVQAIKAYGFDTPSANLAAILKRDSLNRFINTGGNIYKLNEEALVAADEGYYPKDGTKPLRRRRTNKIKELGITLKQAILMAIEAQPGDFDSLAIYHNLELRFPKAAVNIHITSVNAILNNLSKAGVIKEIAGGRGGTAKRFVKRLQLVEDDTGDRALKHLASMS